MCHLRVGLLAAGVATFGLLLSTPARAERIRITASRLTVRKGPGTTYKRIGSAPKGHTYELLQRKGPWLKIQFGRRGGWIHGRYTSPATGAAPTQKPVASPDATHTVVPSRLNVRKAPSRKARVSFQLRRGNRVSVAETRGTWVRIVYGGRSGWTVGRYLTTGKLPPARRPVPRRRPRRHRHRKAPMR